MKPLTSTLILSLAFASFGFGADDDTAALIAAVAKSKHTLVSGVPALVKSPEIAISAKFEFDDDHKLSLSVYSAEKGLAADAEHNILKEYSADPLAATLAPKAEVFKDVEHVSRSAAQLAITSLAKITLVDAISKAEKSTQGQALSVTPAVANGKGGFSVTVIKEGKPMVVTVGLDGEISK